jgi:tRNA(Ile)-lysidine synthase
MLEWPEACAVFQRLSGAFDPAAKAQLLASTGPVLVGCSGGADSIALLLALKAFLEDRSIALVAACFDHGQREEAAEEGAYVADVCAAIGVPLRRGSAGLRPGLGEAALRQARYAWLGSLYRELGATALCLGHHANDVLETQLLALVSGSGPGGLASPRPVKLFPDGQVRVRPLVNLQRTELVGALREAGVRWCEDASNAEPCNSRNWMRCEWIPAAEAQLGRNLVAAARRTRRLMEESEDALDFAVAGLGLNLAASGGFMAAGLRGQPLAVCRRAFHAWWFRHHGERLPSAEAVDQTVAILSGGRNGSTVSTGPGQWLVLDEAGWLLLRETVAPAQWYPFRIWVGASGPLFLPDGASLSLENRLWETGERPYLGADPGREAWIADQGERFVVRLWEAGDRYRPIGAPGRRKLQDLFTDRAIAKPLRHRLPVITSPDGEIVWVPGFAPAHSLALTPCCNSALRLTYHHPCPRF